MLEAATCKDELTAEDSDVPTQVLNSSILSGDARTSTETND